MQQVAPHREEPLLGRMRIPQGTETIRDGSGKPEKFNYQEDAYSGNFVIVSDAAEILNKVQDQPKSTMKRSLGVNVRNLIQKIENHPSATSTSKWSKESQDVIEAAGNTELCEILDVKPKPQCKACLAYGFKETSELGLHWKSQPVFKTANMELKFEFGRWIKTILNLGSEYLMERDKCQIRDRFKSQQYRNSLQIHMKIKRHKQVSRFLQPDPKIKAKPQQMETVDSPTNIPMHERKWIDIEPSERSLAAYDVSKKVISLLRHNQTVQREEDGAIQFWRIKFHLRNHSSQVQLWSYERWKACLAAGGGSKRRYQYGSDNSGTILYLRPLQGRTI